MSEGDRLVGREAAAVVGQPLHRAAGPQGAEAALDRKQHEVAYGDPADAARAGGPGEDLAVVGVDCERDPHGIAVPAQDLEHVRGPARVRGGRRDLTVMGPLAATPGMARQQQSGPLQHAVDTLVV